MQLGCRSGLLAAPVGQSAEEIGIIQRSTRLRSFQCREGDSHASVAGAALMPHPEPGRAAAAPLASVPPRKLPRPQTHMRRRAAHCSRLYFNSTWPCLRLTLFDLLQQAPNLWRVLLPRRSDLRRRLKICTDHEPGLLRISLHGMLKTTMKSISRYAYLSSEHQHCLHRTKRAMKHS